MCRQRRQQPLSTKSQLLAQHAPAHASRPLHDVWGFEPGAPLSASMVFWISAQNLRRHSGAKSRQRPRQGPRGREQSGKPQAISSWSLVTSRRVVPQWFLWLEVGSRKGTERQIVFHFQCFAGAPEEIRTPDPQIRSQRTVDRQVRARVAMPRPSHSFCLRLFSTL